MAKQGCTPSHPCPHPMNYWAKETLWGGGQAPEPAITPADIQPAFLERWLEAGKETGFTDGALMSQITDWSGKGKHLTATGGNRATYKTNIINGLPVIRCVGASIYDSIGGKADDNFKHQGNFTSIKIVRSNVDNANHYFFDNCSEGVSNIGYSERFLQIGGSPAGGFRCRVQNGSGTSYVDCNLSNTAQGNPNPNVEGAPPVPKDVWHIIVTRVDGGLTYQAMEIEVDNLLRGWANKVGTRSASTSTSNPAWFSKVGGTEKLNADIAFLAEWSTYLTDVELRSLIGNTL